MLLGNSEFGGSDDAGSTVVEEINGGYTPWFESFWEPPSGEIESLLFCVQSRSAQVSAALYWDASAKAKGGNGICTNRF